MKARALIDGDPFLCVNSDNLWVDGPADTLRMLASRWDEATMDALLLVVPLARAHNHGGQGDFHMDPLGRLSRRQPAKSLPLSIRASRCSQSGSWPMRLTGHFRPIFFGTAP